MVFDDYDIEHSCVRSLQINQKREKVGVITL